MTEITPSRPASRPQHSISGSRRDSATSALSTTPRTRTPLLLAASASVNRSEVRLGLLGLAAEERGHVEIVGRLLNDFRDGARRRRGRLDLLGYRAALHRFGFAHSLPGLGHIGWPLLLRLAANLAEAGGDDRDFHGLLHGFVHDGAENDVGVFMRGLLNNRRGF